MRLFPESYGAIARFICLRVSGAVAPSAPANSRSLPQQCKIYERRLLCMSRALSNRPRLSCHEVLTPHRPHCTGEESLPYASVHSLLEAAVPSEIDARRLRYVMIACDLARAADATRTIIDAGYPRACIDQVLTGSRPGWQISESLRASISQPGGATATGSSAAPSHAVALNAAAARRRIAVNGPSGQRHRGVKCARFNAAYWLCSV